MIFRQLFDRDSCTYTYLLADEVSRDAVLIDPVFEHHERDAAMLRELGLTLKFTLDTHCHADHVTGAWRMKAALGSRIALSGEYDAENVDAPLQDGDVVRFGDHYISVRSTPGHTAGCLTFVRDGHELAFTGDCLLIRGAGRTDFQEGDARQMYSSIQDQIFSLPDKCLIYPAHDYNGRTVSTVGEERAFNERIGGNADERDFVGYMENLGLPHPRKLSVALPANMRCGKPDEPISQQDWAPLVTTFSGLAEVPAQWVADHLDELTVLDVRGFGEQHEGLGEIVGSIHIPIGELAERVNEVPDDRPVVAVCHAGRRSALACKILKQNSYSRVANVTGGMVQWRLLGLPVAAAQ